MSHWYRTPQALSMRHLIRRTGESLILDRGIDVPLETLRAILKNVEKIQELDPSGNISLKQIVGLCQQIHGLLVTADQSVMPLLISETAAPWGAVLLPDSMSAQVGILRRLAADELVGRLSVDSGLMVEQVRRNRLFLDLRHNTPVVSVFCNCRWIRSSH